MNQRRRPAFSIICATYNSGDKLGRTMRSVLSQAGVDLEFIVVDGASTDNSLAVVERVNDPRVRVLSEPDKGVYDAMNKGVKQAQGDFVYFLGAGDELLPGALAEVKARLPQPSLAFVYGDVWLEGKRYNGAFSALDLCRRNICHQAIFYSRDVFQKVGHFNLKYRALADWEHNLRCFGSRAIQKLHLPVVVANFEPGGASASGDQAFEADSGRLVIQHLGLMTYVRVRLAKLLST